MEEGGEETRQWMQVLPWRRSNMAPSWMVRAVVLAHSERCHSDLAAPQPHPQDCCLFAPVSLVLLLVCASTSPFFGPQNIRKRIIRHAHRIVVSIVAHRLAQLLTFVPFLRLPVGGMKGSHQGSSRCKRIQSLAHTHLHYAMNVPPCSLLCKSMSVCSAAVLQRVVASAGSSAYAAPGSMGRTVRSVLPITTVRASCAYPA
jgi:hypothetical protein